MHSPVQIEVALHYWYASDEHPRVAVGIPAYREAALYLVEAGLLTYDKASYPSYRKTDGLKLYVDALCNVPWPRKVWQMPS